MMNKTNLLTCLHRHQDGVLVLLRQVESLLQDRTTHDIAALARLRWAMMRALTEYQLFKHNEIFDPAIGRAMLGSAERAARLKQSCVAMAGEFRAHVVKWSATDVAGAWSTYQPATLAMIGRLRAHITRERAECESLLDRAA